MQRSAIRFPVVAAVLAALSCGGGPPKTAPEPSEHSLSGLAGQAIAVLPAFAVRVMPGSDWGSSMGRTADVKTTLDADILAALDERGLKKTWIFPADLRQSHRRNAAYAADPDALAEEPLRSPSLIADTRLPDPLASQIRTLVALHDNVRLVLAPVELRLEKAGPTGGRGVLRVVLLDARSSVVRWIGEVSSDTTASFGPVVTASVAAKLANLVASP